MAVHKVPQDVEAEDKFLGPLSFKQFLFFGGALITGFLMFQIVTSGVGFLAILILPIFAVCVIMAFPWTKDQPTELWLASRIRFLLVPRKRIWDQDDVKDLVTITVPKREVHIYSDGLSQTQVKSRLNALANVIDSKGWAVKNPVVPSQTQTDRLAHGTMATTNPTAQLDEPDPYDDHSSAIAQHFESMIQESQEKHRDATREKMNQALHGGGQVIEPGTASTNASSPWFLQQGHINDAGMSKFNTTFEESLDEQKFLEKVHQQQEKNAHASTYSRMKVIQPLSAQGAQEDPIDDTTSNNPQVQQYDTANSQQNAHASSVNPVDPAILALAQNDDLNIETIAREANREIKLEGDSEVIISLHDDHSDEQ